MADGATFRSTRLDAPVGASIPLADAPAWTMIDVLAGKVDRTATGPEGARPPFWNPIHGGALRAAPDWTFELAVAGDEPATINEMTVLAGASLIVISSAVPVGFEYLLDLRKRARAQDNQVFVASANLVGDVRGDGLRRRLTRIDGTNQSRDYVHPVATVQRMCDVGIERITIGAS